MNGTAVEKLQVKNVSGTLPLISASGGGSPEIVYVTAPFSSMPASAGDNSRCPLPDPQSTNRCVCQYTKSPCSTGTVLVLMANTGGVTLTFTACARRAPFAARVGRRRGNRVSPLAGEGMGRGSIPGASGYAPPSLEVMFQPANGDVPDEERLSVYVPPVSAAGSPVAEIVDATTPVSRRPC